MEHHAADLRLHQSHADAGGAGAWPLALFGRILPRHLEIIFEINARFLDEARMQFLGDEARIARLSLIDEYGERYVRMAQSRVRRQPRDQRRGRAALRAAEAGRAARLPRAVAGEVQQQDQRRHAAALADAGESAAGAPDHLMRSATAGSRDLDAAARARAAGRRCRFLLVVARGQAREQGRVRALRAAGARHDARSGLDVRRAGQAHPRVQAPAPEHPARRSRSTCA